MSRQGIVAGLVGVVGLGAVIAVVLRPSDEARVREAFARTVKAVEVKENDSPLARVARVKGTFAETTTDDVRAHVDELGLDVAGRQAFSAGAAQAGLAFGSASAEVLRADVTLDPGKTSARLDATVVVTGTRGGERRLDRRDVHALFRNDDGWRITSVEVFAPSPRSP